jgi:glycosyltransferase involved in cell wall biosynthesis
MPPLRISHLELGKRLYGGAFQVLALLRLAPKDLDEHHLFAARGSAIARAAEGIASGLQELPMRGEMDPRLYFTLVRRLRHLRPQILHIHSRRGADFWGLLAARRLKIPVVLSRRVDNPESLPGRLLKYRPATRIVGISREICRVLARQGVPAAKIVCIPSGVDTHHYRPDREAPARLRKVLGLSGEARAVGMVAQFIPRKGHATLLEAAPEVLHAHPEAHFVLFGEGPLREELRKEASLLPHASRVHFPGFRDDLHQLLPGLDVLAHPASKEGLGVSLLQAGACEVPLVAGRAGGIPEIVLDGQTGFLHEPGNGSQLGSRLCEVLANPELARTLGQKARQHIERHFSEETMARQNLRLYREILNELQ